MGVSRNVARSTPMIENILLDIDGVSNTFHKHVFDYLRLHIPMTRTTRSNAAGTS